MKHSEVKIIFFAAFKLVIKIKFELRCGLLKKKDTYNTSPVNNMCQEVKVIAIIIIVVDI